ncbi:MAG: hypothetical protein ACREL4_06000, partial [Gemmatimonadales bacterium]
VLIRRAPKVSMARHETEVEAIGRRRRAVRLLREATAEGRVGPSGRVPLGGGAKVVGALDIWQTSQSERQERTSEQLYGRSIAGTIEVVLELSEAFGVRDGTDRIPEALERRHGRARLRIDLTGPQRDHEQHKGGDTSGKAY